MTTLPKNIAKYRKEFSEVSFWNKMSRFGKKAGVKVLYAALLVFYALKDPAVSAKDKAILMGALGYFILPLDLIPDFLIGGFIDDLSALLFALKKVYDCITPETKARAKETLKARFGPIAEEEMKLF